MICSGKSVDLCRGKGRNRKKVSPLDTETSDSRSSESSEHELEPANVAASNWSLLASIWPVDERPENLRREEVVNAIDFTNLLAMAKYNKEVNYSTSSGASKTSFTKDTLPSTTLFKEGRDDAVKKLHPARFLRLPLANPKKWWGKMPTVRSHKYRNIPLKFTGCHGQVSEKTIEAAHDRANAHQLKHFYGENLTVSSKPFKKIERKDDEGLSTITDYLWEDPATLGQVQDAMINYQAVTQQLWPYDMTPTILMKILNKYKWCQAAETHKDKVQAATAFFNSVMRENAGRAVRAETIMDFTKMEQLLKDTLTAHGISCAVPIGKIPRLEPSQQSRKPQERSTSRQGSYKKPAGSGSKFQTAKVNNVGCCYGFNLSGCNNPTQFKNGCKDALGREFAHYCNSFNTQSQTHCLKPHPRSKHV